MTRKTREAPRGLSNEQVAQFISDGYVRVDQAFPRALATQGRARMWRDIDADPHNPDTWTDPVVRLWAYWQKPFREAANTPILHRAFDQLVGTGRWVRRDSLGQFVVRFPSTADPGDTTWHVDASFPGPELDGEIDENTDFTKFRVNVTSRGRSLLMLFLFSDVGDNDAPTRLRVGSHLHIARHLAPAGDAGLNGEELDVSVSEGCREVAATGPAGTVYLCHPFLVHASQPHHGSTPRFMAQPELEPAEPFSLHRADETYSPVETAIRHALRDRARP